MNTDFKSFKEALRERVVNFKFNKKDGTVREAKGTTKPDLIPETQLSNKTSRTYTPNPNVVKYFDTEKEGWRSFNEENFIGFE